MLLKHDHGPFKHRGCLGESRGVGAREAGKGGRGGHRRGTGWGATLGCRLSAATAGPPRRRGRRRRRRKWRRRNPKKQRRRAPPPPPPLFQPHDQGARLTPAVTPGARLPPTAATSTLKRRKGTLGRLTASDGGGDGGGESHYSFSFTAALFARRSRSSAGGRTVGSSPSASRLTCPCPAAVSGPAEACPSSARGPSWLAPNRDRRRPARGAKPREARRRRPRSPSPSLPSHRKGLAIAHLTQTEVSAEKPKHSKVLLPRSCFRDDPFHSVDAQPRACGRGTGRGASGARGAGPDTSNTGACYQLPEGL